MTTNLAGSIVATRAHLTTTKRATLWTVISGTPPIIVGAAGVVIMAVEGRILGASLVLLLVALHRYAGSLLTRRYVTINQTADWTAIRVLTTVVCLSLPFYLAITIG